jgi:hypothetical protein
MSEQEDRSRDLSEQLHQINDFLRNPFWKDVFEPHIQEQYNLRLGEWHTPVLDVAGLLRQEFQKGEAAGLYQVLRWVELKKQELETLLQEFNLEDDENADLETDPTAGRSDGEPEWNAIDSSFDPYGS